MSWLIILLNFVSFIYIAFLQASQKNNYPLFAAAFIISIGIVQLILMKKNFYKIKTELYFIVIIVFWLLSGFYTAALINLFLFFLQLISKRDLIVKFFDDQIIYPSFPRKHLFWQDLRNVILKDGLLTIDLKNNRLIQNHIISVINEKEFNEFCRKEMIKRRSNDRNDNDFYDAISALDII